MCGSPLRGDWGASQNKRYVAALVLRSDVGAKAATKRTPHDESCGLFPHLHPCVPCSDCSTTVTMGYSMYSALLVFILIKIVKFILRLGAGGFAGNML